MKKIYFIVIIALSTSNLFGQWELMWIYNESISNYESIQFTDSGKGMIVGFEQNLTPSLGAYVLRTYDYGSTWDTALFYPQYSIFTDIEIINNFTAYVVGSYNATNTVVAKTTDFGNTWDTTLFNFSTYVMSTIDFPSDSIGYIGCIKGLYKTVNAGDTWLLIDTVINFNNGDLTFINDTIGYYGPYLKTTDGGYSWTQVSSLPALECFASYPSDSIGYFVCYDNGNDSAYTYKSTDAGATWNIISVRYVFNFIKSLYFINDTIGYCGGFWHSEKTTDGGLTWSNQTPVADWINDFYFINIDTGYVISSDGILWRTFNGGETFIKDNKKLNIDIIIYPNPTTGKISIEADKIEGIEIMNIEGRQVYVGKGNEVDLCQEPKGIYIIKVITDKQIITRKLIKQ